MRAHPPILNRSGYLLEEDALWLLQKDGWVSIPLDDVAEIKQVSVATTELRLTDGRKKTLTLSHLSTRGLAAVVALLKSAAHNRRAAHAVGGRKAPNQAPDPTRFARVVLNVRQKMKSLTNILFPLGCLALASCASHFSASRSEEITAQRFVAIYHVDPLDRMSYYGSDPTYHYFFRDVRWAAARLKSERAIFDCRRSFR